MHDEPRQQLNKLYFDQKHLRFQTCFSRSLYILGHGVEIPSAIPNPSVHLDRHPHLANQGSPSYQ